MLFGKYKLISLLGRGGMGEVFLARGPQLKRPVVIKRILASMLSDTDMLRAFLDETRIAARLRHPNIVRIDELGEVEGEWFVRMEYVEGPALSEVLKRAARKGEHLPLEAVLSIALERSSVSFGNATTGATPSPVSERVTVVSNNAAGYAVSVHRTAFQPADLPLGIAGTAPSGGQIGGGLSGGAMAAIPIPPAADLLVGTTAARSAGSGDVWDTRLGFVSPLPSVPAGRYTATVTFTVIGR